MNEIQIFEVYFFFGIKIYIFNHFFSISVGKTILFVYLSINCYKENNLLVSILFMQSQYLAIMVNMLTSIDFFFLLTNFHIIQRQSNLYQNTKQIYVSCL